MCPKKRVKKIEGGKKKLTSQKMTRVKRPKLHVSRLCPTPSGTSDGKCPIQNLSRTDLGSLKRRARRGEKKKKALGAGRKTIEHAQKSQGGAVFTAEEGTLDPGGVGPPSLGQLTGIHGECAAGGAKALHNPAPLRRAKPSMKTRAR